MITRFGPGGCECCENIATFWQGRRGEHLHPRCWRHQGRNRCIVEGCQRSTAATNGLGSDTWVCSEHWRRYVPPHSKLRRAYHRFWRQAKRYGWTPELLTRFHRFWDGLVKRIRRQSTEGGLDVAEIIATFGWGQE